MDCIEMIGCICFFIAALSFSKINCCCSKPNDLKDLLTVLCNKGKVLFAFTILAALG